MQTTEPGERNQRCFEGASRERAFLASGVILRAGLGKVNNVLMSREEEKPVLLDHPG